MRFILRNQLMLPLKPNSQTNIKCLMHVFILFLFAVWLCVCVCVYITSNFVVFSCSVLSDSLRSHGLQPARLLCPWHFQAKILEWVTIFSFRGSSLPRDGICISYVSCISGRFFSTEPPGKPKCTHNFPQIFLWSSYPLDS